MSPDTRAEPTCETLSTTKTIRGAVATCSMNSIARVTEAIILVFNHALPLSITLTRRIVSNMDGPLCSEEYEALDKLGDLLRDPAKFGVVIDRGTNPHAAKTLDDGINVLRTIWPRRATKMGVV